MVVLQPVDVERGGILHVVDALLVHLVQMATLARLGVQLRAGDQVLLLPQDTRLVRGQLAAANAGVDGAALVDLARINRKRWLVPVARLSLTFSGTPMA